MIVPKYFPKINPLISAKGDAKPKSKIHIIEKIKQTKINSSKLFDLYLIKI